MNQDVLGLSKNPKHNWKPDGTWKTAILQKSYNQTFIQAGSPISQIPFRDVNIQPHVESYLHWHVCLWTPSWTWTQTLPYHVQKRLCEYCTHSLRRGLEWDQGSMEQWLMCPPGSGSGSGVGSGGRLVPGISYYRGLWVKNGPEAQTQELSSGWGQSGHGCHWHKKGCSCHGWPGVGSRAWPRSHRCDEGSPPWRRQGLPVAETACWYPEEVRMGSESGRIFLFLSQKKDLYYWVKQLEYWPTC